MMMSEIVPDMIIEHKSVSAVLNDIKKKKARCRKKQSNTEPDENSALPVLGPKQLKNIKNRKPLSDRFNPDSITDSRAEPAGFLDSDEKILKPHILTRILFYIDNKHTDKYNDNFNNLIINKFSLINTTEITHPKKESIGITLSLNGLLNESYFNNITKYVIDFFKDDSIILKYRSGKENEDMIYTFINKPEPESEYLTPQIFKNTIYRK